MAGYIIRREGEDFQIVYNGQHPKTRQRFTVASQLAHFMLHKDKLCEKNNSYEEAGNRILFYPENVLLRGSLSNTEEIEANRLGAEILRLIAAIDVYTASLDNTMSIPNLADIFDVAPAAMSVHLCIPMDI